MTNLLVFALTAFIAFLIGVIKARTVTAAADRLQAMTFDAAINTAAVLDRLIVHMENGAAAGRTFAAAAADRLQVLHGAVIESCSDNLPETSVFALTITAADVRYSAGEYLMRDNGRWTNVYLTAYARTLICTSADVIALNPATACDSRGTQHVWFVSL